MDPRPTTICIVCDRPLAVGDALKQVWVYAGVRDGVAQVEAEAEAAHLSCSRPGFTWAFTDRNRRTLKETSRMPLPARAPAHQCLTCGKVYEPGDRIVMIFRVLGIRKDPGDGMPGVECGDEWETAHLSCSDTKANGALSGALVVLT